MTEGIEDILRRIATAIEDAAAAFVESHRKQSSAAEKQAAAVEKQAAAVAGAEAALLRLREFEFNKIKERYEQHDKPSGGNR